MGPSHRAGWTPPAEFDEYQLVGPLGAGGMGQVFLARDVVLDRTVAIKFLLDGDRAAGLERFRIEARALARLQHPNVVMVHRTGDAGGYPYLVSEHVRGRSLAQIAKPLPWPQVLEIGVGLARGLAVAHQAGVLHRDIKSANAMLADDGSVKLLDFGLAKLSGVAAAASAAAAIEPPAELAHGTPDGTPPARAWAEADPPPPTVTRAGRRRAPPAPPASGADPRLALTLSAAPPRSPPAAPARPPAGSPSLTQDGAMLGTPSYMAPEAWRGAAMTAASDVYSMGVVMYELCAGHTPWRGLGLTQLAAVVASAEPPPLLDAAPDVDPRLAAIIDRCRARAPGARYPSAIELRDALEELTGARPDAAPDGNPYRGLQAFEAEHRALFFGRDRAIGEVVERLRHEAFVLIAGDSGAGKSSLCRAGVIPAILDGALGGDRRWRALTVVLGPHPLAALVATLAPALGAREDAVLAELAEDPAALGRGLRCAAGEHGGFVVLIDQLEELVTLAEPGEAERVAEVVRHLAVTAPSVRLLATVRGDFLTRVAARFGRADELMRAVHLLLPPGRDELRCAIVDPARRKGVTFESEPLVERLVEAGARADGGLPLLQFALAQLWSARAPGESVIRATTLAAIGGVEGALARHADDVMARLWPASRAAARRILLKLVSAHGTRARRDEAALAAGDPDAAAAIDALVRGRLLVARAGGGGTAYEVAHEALVDGWAALRAWHEHSKEARAAGERVERAAADWHRLGRRADGLWGDRQLAELAAAGPEVELGPAERGFVAASRRSARRRRWRRRAALIAVPAMAVAIWLGLRITGERAREREVARREREAAVHVDAGHALAARAAPLRRGAFALFDVGLDRLAERAWRDARALDAGAAAALSAGSRALEAALLVDRSRARLRRELAALTYDRALLAEAAGDATQLDELLARLALWDVDGAQRARWQAPAAVSLATGAAAVPVAIERYVERDGHLVAEPVGGPRTTPIAELALPPGSYRFTFDAGGLPIRYPVRLGRGERFAATVALPDPARVPAGFAFVPAGRFRFGYRGDQDLRRAFFGAPPEHDVVTPAYLIARHEVTLRDWIAFLDALPPAARAARAPRIGGASSTFGDGPRLRLARHLDGWHLELQPTVVGYRLGPGQPLIYRGRTRHAAVAWERLPVTGISMHDARAYAAWLDATGRVPGARLCRAVEWERAARGADARSYPTGGELAAGDASTYETHRTDDLAGSGPDEVGAHPASRSPFDVDDLAGNVWEWVQPLHGHRGEIRGGAWYFTAFPAQAVNRQEMEPEVRDIVFGLRICADAPAPGSALAAR